MSLPLAGGAEWLQHPPPRAVGGTGGTGDKHRAETGQVLAASVTLVPLQPWRCEARPNWPWWPVQRSGKHRPSRVSNHCWARLSCLLLPTVHKPRAVLSFPGEGQDGHLALGAEHHPSPSAVRGDGRS